jgi:hypothetical protein
VDPETGAEKPYAIIIPREQKDPAATYKMLWVLQFGDVEISRAKASFTADGKQYPAGTHVILMAQPASAFAKTLTEVQHYPDLRQYPGGPPQRPYDVTAYTMPMLMGVETVRTQQPFQADLETLAEPIAAPPGSVIGGRAKKAYVFAHDNAGILALNRLAKAGLRAQFETAPITVAGRQFATGVIVVPVEGQKGVHEALAAAAQALPITVRAVNEAVPPGLNVRLPRVGLYKSYVASMDEGWTRWIFEQWDLPFVSLLDREVRAGNLRAKFDVIILPQQSPNAIINGFAPGTMPDEYVGGIGKQGVTALREFVEAGGTLVTLDSASMLPVQQFELPVKNALQGLSGGGRDGEEGAAPQEPAARRPPSAPVAGRDSLGPSSAAFYAPGSIVKTKLDLSSPITFGSDPESIAWFEQSPAFDVGGNARAIVTYPDQGSPLLSGWLLGAERLNGKAAVVEAPLGKGRVILFGFRPQYRAQTWSTFKLLFNSLYYATADQRPEPSEDARR